jgi:hypothetical protein
MWQNPLWILTIFFFAAVFNLAISMMMFYLRFKGRSENYTKSQLWALSILACLFLLNSVIIVHVVVHQMDTNLGLNWKRWWFWLIWSDCVVFTSALLLLFGLVYPRPVMEWRRLRWLVIFVIGLGILAVILESFNDHSEWMVFLEINRIHLYQYFAIYIPVFIWLGEYSRQPSRESRMIYTILIWGFLFLYISSDVAAIFYNSIMRTYFLSYRLVYIGLSVLALIRMGHALWMNRKRWSAPETMNLVLLGAAVLIGVITGVWGGNPEWTLAGNRITISLLLGFLHYHAGWMLLRPVLFSYGLLRYRLMGSQVKPERALATLIAILAATFVGILIVNILYPLLGPVSIIVAIVVGVVLLVPFWKASERLVFKYVVRLENVEAMSMRRRRNIYLMGLQTAVFRGRIHDERDYKAIKNLKEELGITDREHDLLLESISMHEASRIPEKNVEEVYIIHKHGLLISHYKSETREADEDDSDVFAGMFTAITEFVQETMKKGEEGGKTTDTIDYGPATMAIERDQNVLMAALITGVDDLELRQLMRDTLAEINEKWKNSLTADWNGDLDAVRGIEKVLREFVARVKRRS